MMCAKILLWLVINIEQKKNRRKSNMNGSQITQVWNTNWVSKCHGIMAWLENVSDIKKSYVWLVKMPYNMLRFVRKIEMKDLEKRKWLTIKEMQ